MRYISFKYAVPFVDSYGNFCISWEGEVLRVDGVTDHNSWIVKR
jgi:hypothetical protein